MTYSKNFRNVRGPREFLAWGKNLNAKQISSNIRGNVSALIFAAVLIACSVSVGCSSDKPKQVSSNNQIPMTQAPSPIAPTPAPAPVMQAENKPAPKKIVHRKPATVNYTDKNYGVTFEYPRRYAIETGDAATDLLTSSVVPMNFVEPGGVALAAVELPETGYANTDFSSAFFDVSVHKGLTADQCGEFAVPEPKVKEMSSSSSVATATSNDVSSAQASSAQTPAAQTASAQTASTQATSSPSTSDNAPSQSAATQVASTQTAPADSQSASASASTTVAATPDAKSASETQGQAKSSNEQTAASSSSTVSEPQGSKLMLGDLELRGTEAVSGEGTRQSDAKYFHVYRNGACYEFAVNVTTVASEDSMTKHVDRDRVFANLEKILATVKIDELKPTPAVTPEVSTAAPAAPATQENPAQ